MFKIFLFCYFCKINNKIKKIMKAKKIILLIVLCFSQFFIQCSTDENKGIERKMTDRELAEIIQLTNYISGSLGTDSKNVVYDSERQTFIIGKDILMSLEEAKDRYNHSDANVTGKIDQMGAAYKMTPERAASVKIFISAEVSPDWRIAINKAIENWNTINSGITITVSDAKTYPTIVISAFAANSSKAIAYAHLPYNGVPGTSLEINAYYNNLEASKKIFVITHELGHTFGLNHTNESEGSLIPCTPISDDGSIMFSLIDQWTDFSAYDTIAISSLYPVAVGTKKLYRFKKNQYYYYTTDPCEIIPGKEGYVLDKDAGYLYEKQIEGTVPLYRTFNGAIVKDHSLSKNQTTADDIILGYLFSDKQPQTTALYTTVSSYEYFPDNYAHYLYTTNFDKDVFIMSIIGYVPNKIILEDKQNSIVL